MENRFTPPQANLEVDSPYGNNSGQGSGTPVLCLVPYLGFLVAIYLGIKGRELAWRNKRWQSVEHFKRVQRLWSIWGTIIVVGIMGIGILAAIAIPAYQGYVQRHVVH